MSDCNVGLRSTPKSCLPKQLALLTRFVRLVSLPQCMIEGANRHPWKKKRGEDKFEFATLLIETP